MSGSPRSAAESERVQEEYKKNERNRVIMLIGDKITTGHGRESSGWLGSFPLVPIKIIAINLRLWYYIPISDKRERERVYDQECKGGFGCGVHLNVVDGRKRMRRG